MLAQDARDLLRAGDVPRAAGLAADVVVLADSAGLGPRRASEARLLLGRALLAAGDEGQAASTFLAALDRAAAMPMPLRAADALDAPGPPRTAARPRGTPASLAATAAALRAPRARRSPGGTPPTRRRAPAAQRPRRLDRRTTSSPPAGVEAAVALFTGATVTRPGGGRSTSCTTAERHVADRVADGLTSRQIAEELFISPRTVDAHLTHIYRKLDISSRARLAALVADQRLTWRRRLSGRCSRGTRAAVLRPR